LPSFDLQVEGHADYSFMDWLAQRGHDVWTLDHEGYGRSGATDGNSAIAEGVRDLEAAPSFIARAPGESRVNLYGLASGALRAGAFAQQYPERVARLALDALVWTGEGSPTLAERRKHLDSYRRASRRPIDERTITQIFTRDRP